MTLSVTVKDSILPMACLQDLDLVTQLHTLDTTINAYKDVMNQMLVNISNIENELSNR